MAKTLYSVDDYLTQAPQNLAGRIREWLLSMSVKHADKTLQLRASYKPSGVRGFRTLGIDTPEGGAPGARAPGKIKITRPSPSATDNLISQIRTLIEELGDIDGQLRVRGWVSGNSSSPDLDFTRRVTDVDDDPSTRNATLTMALLDRQLNREQAVNDLSVAVLTEGRALMERAMTTADATIAQLTAANQEKDKQIAAIATVRAVSEGGASLGSSIMGPLALVAMGVLYRPLVKALGLPKHTTPQQLIDAVVQRGQRGISDMIGGGTVPPSPTGRLRDTQAATKQIAQVDRFDDDDDDDDERQAEPVGETMPETAPVQADAETTRDASSSSSEASPPATAERPISWFSGAGADLADEIAAHSQPAVAMETLLKGAGMALQSRHPAVVERISDENDGLAFLLGALSD